MTTTVAQPPRPARDTKSAASAAVALRRRPGWRALITAAATAVLVLTGPASALAATPSSAPAAGDPCSAQENALTEVHQQITTHNAEPHQFELPAQNAALQAYDAQAEKLTAEQADDLADLRACLTRTSTGQPPAPRTTAPRTTAPRPAALPPSPPTAPATKALPDTAPATSPTGPAPARTRTPQDNGAGSTANSTRSAAPRPATGPSVTGTSAAPRGRTSPQAPASTVPTPGTGPLRSSGSDAAVPAPSSTTGAGDASEAGGATGPGSSATSSPTGQSSTGQSSTRQSPAERQAVTALMTAVEDGSPMVAYTPQELGDLAEALKALPDGGVWFSRDLSVLPPALDRAVALLERFQARALAAQATSTLHDTAAPGGGVRPRPVFTVKELLRRIPGLLQLDPATMLAVVGSPLNAYWPGSDVDRSEVRETLQTGVDQVRLARPDGPGHTLRLGPGPRGTNNETIYFNRHRDAEDLNDLVDSFPCLDALIPAPRGEDNPDGDAPPSFVSLKTHTGKNPIPAYLLDIRKVVADQGGCASKAAAKFAALARDGRSPLRGECARDVVSCISNHGSVGVPHDQVPDVRAALIAELTSSKHTVYGLPTAPTPAQAQAYANRWISDTGYPLALTEFA